VTFPQCQPRCETFYLRDCTGIAVPADNFFLKLAAGNRQLQLIELQRGYTISEVTLLQLATMCPVVSHVTVESFADGL
jgi:hypothetical protein